MAATLQFGTVLRGFVVIEHHPALQFRRVLALEVVDAGVRGNPSHSGIDDIEREYAGDLRARLVLYHYGNANDGDTMQQRGYRVARAGDAFELPQLAVEDAPA